MVYVKLKVSYADGSQLSDTEDAYPIENFGKALFDQVDFYLGSANITTANNLYAYQAFFEDMLFRYKSSIDNGSMNAKDDTNRRHRIEKSKQVDLFFRLHVSLCSQSRLMINNVPITIRMIRGKDNFVMVDSDKTSKNFAIKISDLSLHIKRCRIFPDVVLGLTKALDSTPINYFVTRNEVKHFSVSKGLSTISFENVFNGMIPRRMLVGFIEDSALNGSVNQEPFHFKHNKLSNIAAFVDGIQYPSLSYSPDYTNSLYIHEFLSIYRYFNQDEGLPQIDIDYDDYTTKRCFYAFDLSPDGSVGAETGVLSLVKRGTVKIDVKFSEALSEALHLIVFAQFDNVISIDKFRNVTTDY